MRVSFFLSGSKFGIVSMHPPPTLQDIFCQEQTCRSIHPFSGTSFSSTGMVLVSQSEEEHEWVSLLMCKFNDNSTRTYSIPCLLNKYCLMSVAHSCCCRCWQILLLLHMRLNKQRKYLDVLPFKIASSRCQLLQLLSPPLHFPSTCLSLFRDDIYLELERYIYTNKVIAFN